MLILGIDPGSRKTGVGIVHHDAMQRTVKLIDAKVLRLDLTSDLSGRLAELAQRLGEILKEYEPGQAILEDVFAGEHARSALILGQARGAVLATLGLYRVPVLHVSPRRVKQAITGSGSASKFQIAQMVSVILKLDKVPAEDAADALGIALSYVLSGSLASPSKKQGLYELARSQGLIDQSHPRGRR